jgi:hypothetical protein
MMESPKEEPARRRSDRILAPIRIRVLGNDARGVSFSEETVTVSFNQQGARISLTHSLLPDDIVLIMNLENRIEDEFRVVGGYQKVFGERQEWGVEALHPDGKIWGITFRPPAEGVQPKVLIECAACRTAAQSPLSSIEYEVLLATGLISRHCDRCGETTRWKPSAQVLTPEIIKAKTVDVAGRKKERRARRLRLTMRVRVRDQWGQAEIAQTRDVSKLGLCFVSSRRHQIGETVYITLPFAENQTPVETPAKVIWEAESPAGRFHGVCYLK